MPNDPESGRIVPTEDGYYEETVVEYVDNRRSRNVLIAVLVVLVLLLAGVTWFVVKLNRPVSAPNASEMPPGVQWVRSIYAWGTTSDTLLNGPVDTAIAPDGTIWVSTNKQFIAGFSPDGRPRRVIAPTYGKSPGQVVAFEGIAVGENGDVYACDFGRNVIMVFTSQGRYLREWPVELPNEIYVRGGKAVVVTLSGVKVFDLNGKKLTEWGTRGKGEANFDVPHGVFVDSSGRIYVSDTQNKRIRAYTGEGRLLWTRGGKEVSSLAESTHTQEPTLTINGVPQNVELPAGMTMDGRGRLAVVDPFGFDILMLDPANGHIVARYGEFGAQDGQFAYPTGISYDPSRDHFAVADTANNRVQIIRLPNTGGNALAVVLTGVGDSPWWICLFPLILLLIAVILMVRRRQRRRADEKAAEEAAKSA